MGRPALVRQAVQNLGDYALLRSSCHWRAGGNSRHSKKAGLEGHLYRLGHIIRHKQISTSLNTREKLGYPHISLP